MFYGWFALQRYTWDTPIKEILGDSFFLNDEYRTNKVTLIDLLSHRVGAARHDFLWILGFITDREDLLKLVNHFLTLSQLGRPTSIQRDCKVL